MGTESLTEVTLRHEQVMRELVAGNPVKDVAIRTGYSESRIHELQRSELFQLQLERLRERLEDAFIEAQANRPRLGLVRAKARSLAGDAVDTLEGVMRQTGDLSNKRKSAMDILALTGDLDSLKGSAQGNQAVVMVDLGIFKELEAEIAESRVVDTESVEVSRTEGRSTLTPDTLTRESIADRQVEHQPTEEHSPEVLEGD